MTDKFETGQIIEGKVTGIQPYGAFVSINENIQGLVHISEITHGFVKDINDHLSIGDNVKVRILNIDEENNKISLSIRATKEAPKTKTNVSQTKSTQSQNDGNIGFNSLKGKLEEWIEQSEQQKNTSKK